MVVGAALVAEALRRGLDPCWNAASARLGTTCAEARVHARPRSDGRSSSASRTRSGQGRSAASRLPDVLDLPESGARDEAETPIRWGRRGQIFTLRILGVSKKRPASHPPLATIVTDSKVIPGIAARTSSTGTRRHEIADRLGVHYSTVSRRVRAVESGDFGTRCVIA